MTRTKAARSGRRRIPRSRTPRFVWGVVGTTYALCLSLVVLLVAMTSFTLIPTLFGWQPHLILTGSMAPRIMPGDVVVSSPIRPTDVMPGRVLLMNNPVRPGELLLHRMVSRNADGSIITRGDANQSADSTPVPASDLRGLPRLRIPMIGLPALWVHDRNWPELAGAVTGLLLAMWGAMGVRAREEVDDEPAKHSRTAVPAMSA